jgi:hypothetical protein
MKALASRQEHLLIPGGSKASVFSAYGTPVLLLASGLIAAGIAVMILFAPTVFFSSYGIDIGKNASLVNELKAPAGALLVAGLLIMAGIFRPGLKMQSLGIATAVYLSYGLSRVLSMVMDGLPHDGLVSAAAIEVAIGAICFVDLMRHRRLTIAGRNAT